MAIPTLEETKLHLRLDDADTAEDALVEGLIDAAVDYASKYIGRPIPWSDDAGDPVDVPPSVKSALLLIVGDLFENREGQFVGVSAEANPAVVNMLHFYRVGLGV